jgi:hypothetical protein
MTARQTIGLLCLAALLPSCTSWVEYSPGPPSVDESRVRVTEISGARLVLEDPFVEDRDYVGTVHGISRRVPLDSMSLYEVPQSAQFKTGLVVVGALALVFVVVAPIVVSDALESSSR